MKKLKLKKVIASTLIVASVLALNPVGASAEWKQDSNGWWNTEGSSWSVGWRNINSKWYYFNTDGYMAHDTIIDGYKLGSDGAWMQTPQNFTTTKDGKVVQIPSDAVKFNNHYYLLIDKGIDWNSAEKYCENLGGHLATITSQEENDFLYNYIKSQGTSDAYFGLTDEKNTGDYKWVNGEPFSSSSYSFWHTGEPNHEVDNEHYGMFYWKYNDGTWNDGTGQGNYYICEWDNGITK